MLIIRSDSQIWLMANLYFSRLDTKIEVKGQPAQPPMNTDVVMDN